MRLTAKKINSALLAILLLGFFNIKFVYGSDNVITVYAGREIGEINKNVYGNNFIGYDPAAYGTFKRHNKKSWEYRRSTMNYGAGVWYPKQNKSVKEVIDLSKQAGITILRFPGGCGTHSYNWKDAVGEGRKRFLYGIDEFLETAGEIGAEAVITVSYFTGNEEDAADLVEYLNAPDDGSNPNGGRDWAAERAENPYKVKYFEIGNEVWHGNHRDIKKVLPMEYAKRYLKYYEAMKAADPSVKIGLVLHTADWNRRVLGIVKGKLDFGIIHTYPTPVWGKKLERMRPERIFSVSLAIPVLKDRFDFPQTLKLLKEKSGRDIPLAITEYNGGFVQDKPVPYRHSLGTALINAELLRIFMKPGHNVIMANYWQFSNSYWGMIKSEGGRLDYMKHDYRNPITYKKRPNFYVYELYNKHFGDILIDTDVKTGSYETGKYKPYIRMLVKRIKSGTIIKKNLLSGKWNIREFPGVYAKEKEGALEIDFKNPEEFNYYHSIKRARVEPDTYYRLSGYIRAEGLTGKKGVCLEILDNSNRGRNPSTAATKEITGTAEWQYLETVYKTSSNTRYLIIRARRIGVKGPLKGRAFFKDVKLEKYIPALDTRIPYLSVNAARNRDGDRVYLMVINKNMDQGITASIELKDFVPAEKASAWVLNGPAVDATNEDNPENVKVVHSEFKVNQNPFEFTFEPHSLTAIGISGE
ncbi:MAG TPA: hypothetical protein ENG83_12135 [Nitrospirae bacterium]|nr:intracellular exo-alpha-L-arabinofuranosidase 2 [bacterium BMS3Abin06]HDH12924.1 hypothetical protein [Nitrospirota bacterium]HDL19849.1 hypothetical protein [Nitrospirota bacterium]HDZ01664.1 hypothetical protein [Nitrospirota bacterium]